MSPAHCPACAVLLLCLCSACVSQKAPKSPGARLAALEQTVHEEKEVLLIQDQQITLLEAKVKELEAEAVVCKRLHRFN